MVSTVNILKQQHFPFIEKTIPFAFDPGGLRICFDYRNTDIVPSIVINDGVSANPIDFVAENFTQFITMLYEPEDLEDI